MFYRSAQVGLVCFDRETGDTINQWVNDLRNIAPDCIVFLVSTKADLLSEEEIKDCQRYGSQKVAELRAHQHAVTSSLTGAALRSCSAQSQNAGT
jgi:GTPase SAR1 family protein